MHANIGANLNFFIFLPVLLMHLRGLKPKNPTGFSQEYESPIPVVIPAVGSFQIHWRPWVEFQLAQYTKIQNFINPRDSLT